MPVLEVENLQKYFPIKKGFFQKTVNHVKAVDGVNFHLDAGETLGLVGESGCGKTTVGRSILRLTEPTAGKVLYKGKDLGQMNRETLRKTRTSLQIIFQDPFSSLSPRLTVERIIGEGLQAHKIGRNRQERRQLVEQGLAEVGLTPEMADRYPHEFSGGQRQRIAIARAVILKPRFLVLDEPTSALDMTIQAQIIQLLRDLQEKYGITYLFISHDLRVIRALCDEVAVMQNGRIVEAGPAQRLFSDPQHPYTRQLFAASFELKARI